MTLNKGMTLLEILVATILLGWLIVGMFSVYKSAQKLMERANRIQYANFLAREKMEELSGYGFDGLSQTFPQLNDLTNFPMNTRTLFQTEDNITGNAIPDIGYTAGTNEFVDRYFTTRVSYITNQDDWPETSSGTVDYRKVEVEVNWNEPS